MPLPLFRGREPQLLNLGKTRRFLLISLTFTIFILSSCLIYFFYFGYHRTSISTDKVRNQGWLRGRWADVIMGEVVSLKNSTVIVEKGGETLDLDLGDKVYYCGERENYYCTAVDSSLVREGQYLKASKPDRSEKEFCGDSILEEEWLIFLWD